MNWLKKPSLCSVLIASFAIQIVGFVGLTGYLAWRNGQQTVSELADRLTAEVSERIDDRLTTYLQTHQQAVEVNYRAAMQGSLNLTDFEQLQNYLWQQMLMSPSLSNSWFANDRGEQIGYDRLQSEKIVKPASKLTLENLSIGTLVLMESSTAKPGKRKYYLVDGKGKSQKLLYTFTVDNRTTPWYRYAKASPRQTWSPIFVDRIVPLLGILALAPVYDRAGKLQGVFGSDLALSDVSTFLHSLDFSPSGQSFIIERSGNLIATSTLEIPFISQPKKEPQRLSAVNSKDTRTRAIAQQLFNRFGSFGNFQKTQHLTLEVEGKRLFVRVTPHRDKYGLDWLIVVVVPESDFTDQIEKNTFQTIILCGIALLLAVGMGTLTASWISIPIQRLSRASELLAEGKWDRSWPENSSIAELSILSRSFHRTAEKLQNYFDRIETNLKESEEKFSTIFSTSPDPILITNLSEGRLLEVNHRTIEFYGYSLEELLDRTGVELGLWANMEDRQLCRQLLHERGKVRNLEVTTRLKSGEIKVVLLSAELCDLKGEDAVIIVIRDISDRTQTEEKLRKSEANLKRAQEMAHCGNWEHHFATGQVYWSEEMYRIHGFDPNLPIPIGEDSMCYIHRDDRAKYRREIIEKVIAQKSFEVDLRILRPDGAIRHIEIRGEPLFDAQNKAIGFFGTVQDITDRKQAEEALQASEARLKLALEASDALTWECDLQTNEMIFTSSTGRSYPRRMSQDEATAMVHPDDREKLHHAHLVAIEQVGSFQLEYRVLIPEPTPEWRWFQMKAKVLTDASGKPTQVVGMSVDITDRKQAERELQQAKEAAEAANQAKSTFLANMSHELRTPLNVILGFTQLMKRNSNLTPENQEYLRIIHRHGDHLLKLINGILDLSKIEAGCFTLEEKEFDLFELLHALRSALGERSQNKGLLLNLEIVSGTPQIIRADEQKLQQVLINLLGNAIKFTPQGSVCLSVGVKDESKKFSDRSHLFYYLQFQVTDTGVGIAAEDLNMIFEAFSQASAGKKSLEGTGLGLTISRKLVQLMGGDITVTSTLGRGSNFQFTIPVQLATGASLESPQPFGTVTGLAAGQPNYRILVVDDQSENRLFLITLLKKVGFEVQEATNGKDAVLQWQQWKPDLIWMDIRMPELNGYEATEQIRADREGGNVVIIALTAQASLDDRLLALSAGCDDYISKPFREETLFSKMAEYLDLRYTYSDSNLTDLTNTHSNIKDELNPENLSVMPHTWVVELHQATLACEYETVKELIAQIPLSHSLLADKLEKLADDFIFEEIEQMVQSYLNGNSSC